MQRERIGLVGCVKSKRSVPCAAADLYVSALFAGRRRWVEASCSRWFILSAKHGLVAPGEVLAPYDETLTTKGTGDRRAWAGRVLAQLREALRPAGGYEFEIHAGAAYVGMACGRACCPPAPWSPGRRRVSVLAGSWPSTVTSSRAAWTAHDGGGRGRRRQEGWPV